MSQSINTGLYTTLNNTVAYTDLGIIFDDTTNNRTINGLKTCTQVPSTTQTAFTNSQQLVTKGYVDTMPTSVINNTLNSTYSYDSIKPSNTVTYSVAMNPTSLKQSFVLPAVTTITPSNILVKTDGQLAGDQLFSFGEISNTRGSTQGMWIAIGGGDVGGAYSAGYSYDGINWVSLNSNILSANKYFGLACNGQMWIASSTSTMRYSYDGFTWNNVPLSVSMTQAFCIASNGQIWVAGGAGTWNLAYSMNGLYWYRAKSGFSLISSVQGVAWNGQMWVCVGGYISCALMYSYDGINWLPSINNPFGGSWAYSVAWNGTIWVVGGGVAPWIVYSYDGILWYAGNPELTIAATVNAIAYNGFIWLAAGSNPYIAYSYNGINWLTTDANSIFAFGSNNSMPSIAWNGQLWVAGANCYSGSTTNSGRMIGYSYNGINWFLSSSGSACFPRSRDTVMGLAWSGKRKNTLYLPMARTLALGQGVNTIAYAYAGTNNILYDGSYNNWTGGVTHLGLPTNTLFSCANAAAWNGTQWIAMGNTVASAATGNTIAVSSIYNGNTYFNAQTGITTGTNSIGNAGNVWTGLGNYIFSTSGNGIGWNGNVWVACGQGGNTLAYSPDGYLWTGLGSNIFSSVCNSVTWNGTYWIATGLYSGINGNTLAYSKDGIVWNGLGNLIFTSQAMAATWSGTIWVAVGKGGNTMAFSYDGNIWTGMGTTIFSTSGICVAVNTTRTMWVAGGQGTNTLVYSTDGISWSGASGSFPTIVNSVVWNGKVWVASGNGTHTLAYSFDGITWTGEGATILTAGGQGIAANMGVGSAIIPINYNAPVNASVPMWIVCGQGTNHTLSYSLNGNTWIGLGINTFTQLGTAVSYSSSGIWVATGSSGPNTGNSMAYSTNGTTWTGLGTSIFYTSGRAVLWNGLVWVAGGDLNAGTNTLAWSSNGIIWTGLGTNIFSSNCYGFGWSGTMWIAVGNGTSNNMAYSYNGINWTGLGKPVFSTSGSSVVWNGVMWIAVGTGTVNTMAYSYNGLNWVGLALTPFSTAGYSVTWNGTIWVAVGSGTNAIAWSRDGITWTGLGVTNAATGYLTTGNEVFWNGQIWMACGQGSSPAVGVTVYSFNGKTWYSSNNVLFDTTLYGIAYNSYFTNKLTLYNYGTVGGTQTLDIVGDTYYQSGYSQLIVNIS
jgi:hypothetical protein